MKWAWKLGQVKGIGIYVHASFVLILAWVAYAQLSQGQGAVQALGAIALVLAVFGTIVLHELGHALTALHFGVRTRDITLYPIGGVARLERMPERPIQELLVALAGPAVNFVIAGIIFCVLVFTNELRVPRLVDVFVEPFLSQLMWINVAIAVFNLIPAFPMDGGRVLRAGLATRMDYVRATQAAASVGQSIALAFGLIGLVANPFLVLIAIFVWLGAASEAASAQFRGTLDHVPVRSVMITDYHTLRPEDPLSVAVAHTLAGFQHDFPVVEGTRIVGVLSRARLIHGLAEKGKDAPVGEVMQREFTTIDPNEMLEPSLARLHESRAGCLPVIRGDRIVGLLTMENVGEFVTFASALRSRHPRDRSVPTMGELANSSAPML